MLRKSMLSLSLLCGCLGLAGPAHAQFNTTVVASGLAQPLFVTAPPGDTTRLFIVEQRRSNGVSNSVASIRVLDLTTNPPTLLPTPFLTITVSAAEDERGLLGMAFHPDYATNRSFFIYYTSPSSVIARYKASISDPNVADPTGTTVLTFAQPTWNHNGGWIGFGPDGYLYIATGDGGGGNDNQSAPAGCSGNAQCLTSYLGKILRIAVTDTGTYTVPADNPWAGMTAPQSLIWAYGLRNPWRSSFDRQTGDLWIGDVGQSNTTGREEVNFQPAGVGGRNYGWPCRHGSTCSNLAVCNIGCNGGTFINPVHNYVTVSGSACTVVGGYVYRGSAIPAFQGRYFFADYCSAGVQSFVYNGTSSQTVTNHGSFIGLTSFGEDAAGELYFTVRGSTTSSTGTVRKIVPAAPANNTCANATLVGAGSHNFNTAGATTTGPDETSGCGFGAPTQIANDIWYRYLAQCSGTATVSLCGANFDTRLAVYASCPSGAGQTIACNDNFCGSASQVSFPVVSGTLYQIRIGGANAVTGSGTMVISCATPPACEGDIAPPGGDGAVGVPDLLKVISSWGPCPAPPKDCVADIAPPGGDNTVGVPDLLKVISSWGPCP